MSRQRVAAALAGGATVGLLAWAIGGGAWLGNLILAAAWVGGYLLAARLFGSRRSP